MLLTERVNMEWDGVGGGGCGYSEADRRMGLWILPSEEGDDVERRRLG
jgi:hypothetical protein